MRALFCLLPACMLTAGELRIAVASNAEAALSALSEKFEATHDVRVIRISGSTGRHHAQIRQGAPFDLLLAADAETPLRLHKSGHAAAVGTYAYGVLVLWSPHPGRVDGAGDVLRRAEFRRLAVANAAVSPYGRAAEEVLSAMEVDNALRPRIVRGSNIGQTAHFVSSGAADLGFVALSQIRAPEQEDLPGSYWFPPADMYSPLEQKWALINDTPAARSFLLFLQTPEARELLLGYGYTLPESDAPDPG